MSASVLAEPKSDSNGGDQIPWTTGCNVISPAASVDAPVDVTGASNGWGRSGVGFTEAASQDGLLPLIVEESNEHSVLDTAAGTNSAKRPLGDLAIRSGFLFQAVTKHLIAENSLSLNRIIVSVSSD